MTGRRSSSRGGPATAVFKSTAPRSGRKATGSGRPSDSPPFAFAMWRREMAWGGESFKAEQNLFARDLFRDLLKEVAVRIHID